MRFTPWLSIQGDSIELLVLELAPETRYLLQPVAHGPGGSVSGEPLAFTTGALPTDILTYRAEGTPSSPGYVVFAVGRYGLVIDDTGRVVWYRYFAEGPVLNFMVGGGGSYVARPTTADPADNERWQEIDAAGNVVRTFGCSSQLRSRLHEAVSDGNGGHWLLCDEVRTMDLTAHGGLADARVTGTAIQHVAAGGSVLFHWSAFDHFDIGDANPTTLTAPDVNWTHGNALDLTPDGNLVVSFRNLNEITKISATSGAVLWRMGGRRNQFAFEGSTVPPFSGQHSVRMPRSGEIILLDNLGETGSSQAERYQIEESTLTARLVRAYAPLPPVVTAIGGSVQELPNVHTLVSFGTTGRVEEYDALGRVAWRLVGNPGYVFRAQRIRSLYAPAGDVTR